MKSIMKAEKIIVVTLIIVGVGTLIWSVSNALSRNNTGDGITSERYEQAVADELLDKCKTPPGYTEEDWQEHMSHHPDRYKECFTEAELNKAVVRNLNPNDLVAMMENIDITLIDTHIPEQARIAGTDAFIPYNEIEQKLAKLPSDKSAPIVLYCRSGNMSAQASKTLTDLGYTNVYNLAGGTKAWIASGYAVEEISL